MSGGVEHCCSGKSVWTHLLSGGEMWSVSPAARYYGGHLENIESNMNLFVFVFCFLSLLLPKYIGAQPTPQVCYTPIPVGNNIVSPTIPTQSGHGAGQSVIVYDSTYTIPCTCGLVSGWQLVRYDNFADGCNAYSCHATLMVYRNVNVTAMTATLVGYYNATNIETYPITTNYITINFPIENWIPVKYGDNLGWEGSPSSVTYYEEPTCSGACPSGLLSTSKHFYGSVKSPLTAGTKIGFFNGPSNGYANWRYFGFRAIVLAGTPPYFSTLPHTLSIDDTTPVGTVVWTVDASDDEPSQTLTLRVEWECPLASYFYMDPDTGDVTVNRSLIGGPSLHTLSIEASDDCLTSTASLTINVVPTVNTTNSSTTASNTTTLSPITVAVTTTPSQKTKAANVLRSPLGASLLAITILGSLVAVGSSIGMCVLGSYMSDITKELGEIPPLKKSQATPNNEKTPWRREETPLKNERLPKTNNNQERGNLVNRKQNDLDSNTRSGIPPRMTSHGASSPAFSRLTPVEQSPKPSPSPRASPRNYPPRDMLYW